MEEKLIGTPEQYLSAMETSLEQKKQVLSEIKALTEKQAESLAEEEWDMDVFEGLVQRKQPFVDRILELDEGFEQVYGRIKEAISREPDAYKEQIGKLQEKITALMELGVEIEAMEKRNKERLDGQLSLSRKKIKSYNKSSQAVANYYKSMSNRHQETDSYFMDKKK